MRSPSIPYPGGKGRLASTIVSFLPKTGRLFVDPCAGRGNVFWAAATALKFEHWWVNDIRTASFFTALREMGDRVRVPERSRKEYTQQWARFKRGDQRSILLEPHLTWGGGGYGTGGPGGKNGASSASYQRTLRECCHLMRETHVRVTSLSWQDMGLQSLEDDDVVFFDPPYYGASVRAYSNRFDHTAMVRLLEKARFKWLLTEYRQDFYVKYLGKPFFTKNVQLVGTDLRKCGQERRTECMWKNY